MIRTFSVQLCAALLLVVGVAGCGGAAPAPSPNLPDLVGLTLPMAKSTAGGAGFTNVSSHDVAGTRNQIVDANWLVCTQSPRPGPSATSAQIDLGVVATAETCPGAAAVRASASPTSVPPTSVPPTAAVVPQSRAAAPPTVPRVTEPARAPEPEPESRSDDDGGSSGGGPVVNPGSFCDPPGAGVTKAGTPMVCRPAKDGRNRWQKA